jgi:hypothetical protein
MKIKLNELRNLIKKIIKEESENETDISSNIDNLSDNELNLLSYNVNPEIDGNYTNGITFEDGLEILIKKIVPNVSEEGLSRVLRNSSEHQENLNYSMNRSYSVHSAVREFLFKICNYASKF